MKPSQNKDVVEGGCTRCKVQFYLPLDEDGNPVWNHVCAPTLEEKIEELTKLVKELKGDEDSR